MSENSSNENSSNENGSWKDTHPEVGALWVKEGKGQKFMSGHFSLDDGKTKHRCVIYSNKYKTGNAPDFRVYLSPEMKAEDKNSGPDILDSMSSQAPDNNEEAIPADDDPEGLL